MGTVADGSDRTVGYIERAGQSIRVVEESAMETAYGRRGGGLYPLALIVAIVAFILVGYPYVAMVPVILLALWIGGSGR